MTDGESQVRDLSAQLMDVLAQDGGAVDQGELKVDEFINRRKELQKQRKRLTADLRNDTESSRGCARGAST